MAVVLSAIAALAPLVIAPGLLLYFDVTPKIAVLLAGAGIGLFVAAWKSGSGVTLPRGLLWLLCMQFVVLVVSTTLSERVDLSIGGTNWRRFGLLTQSSLLVLCILVAASPATHRWLLRAVSAAGAIASAYGIAQYFGWDPFLPAQAYHVGEGIWTIVRPPSTLGYANYAATYFLQSGFFGLALLNEPEWRTDRVIGWVAIVLCPIAILLSGTRAAVLAMVAGALWLLWRTRIRLRARYAAAIAVAAVTIGAFYFSPPGQALRSRIRWAVEDPLGGARLLLWRDSLATGLERWGTGWGPETFSAVLARHESEELAKAYPDFYHESPHNMFLDAFAGEGLPGLLVLAGLCVLGLMCRDRPYIHAAFVAILVSQQFTAFIAVTAFCFYLTLGMLVSSSPDAIRIRLPVWLRTAMMVGGCAFIWTAFPMLRWDAQLARTQKQIEQGEIGHAIATYEGALPSKPSLAGSDLWFSRILLAATQKSPNFLERTNGFVKAYAAAKRATQSAEDPQNAYYNLSAFEAMRNNRAGMEESLREAIRIAPNWFKPHWALAQLLALTGEVDEALQQATLAERLSAGKHPEVGATLEGLRKRKN